MHINIKYNIIYIYKYLVIILYFILLFPFIVRESWLFVLPERFYTTVHRSELDHEHDVLKPILFVSFFLLLIPQSIGYSSLKRPGSSVISNIYIIQQVEN
jgi:hypothetical protein